MMEGSFVISGLHESSALDYTEINVKYVIVWGDDAHIRGSHTGEMESF